MHLLDLHHDGELHQHLHEAQQRDVGHDRPPQQRLDVLRRVVERPRLLIDRVQLLPRHLRMVGDGVLEVVFVEVGIHVDALPPQHLVVLGAGQRGQDVELEHVERKLALDDRDIAPDRFRRVAGEAEDIAGIDEDALRLPGQQHLAVLGDLVLLLLGGDQIVRVDVLEPDEDARHARALGLLDEVRNLVAHRVDLNHQAERDLVDLAQLGEPVVDRFPLPVAGEIVVGDEEAGDALGPVVAHDLLDVVGRPVARLATLHVDDGAERALERAAAAGIEAGIGAGGALRRIRCGRNGIGVPPIDGRSFMKL